MGNYNLPHRLEPNRRLGLSINPGRDNKNSQTNKSTVHKSVTSKLQLKKIQLLILPVDGPGRHGIHIDKLGEQLMELPCNGRLAHLIRRMGKNIRMQPLFYPVGNNNSPLLQISFIVEHIITPYKTYKRA